MRKLVLLFPIFVLLIWGCKSGSQQADSTPIADSLKGTIWDYTLPVDVRVNALIGQMTLEEKISQMMHNAPSIPRLGIPEYFWWNECLHGLARAGQATVFPQAIGLAATFDEKLIYKMAEAISDEARAKHHLAVANGTFQQYMGLNFWSPNINIFRDPRWGRGQETYGEDPYLTSRMGVAFVKGLQGTDTNYYKVIATPKHYAVHSGPEPERHRFDARVDLKDLYETYLPAFEATIREAKAGSVMGAYNRTNGLPCCSHPELLGKILRNDWGFDGFVVSDCGAIRDIWADHKIVATPAEAAALAVKEGCDLECGEVYFALKEAVEKDYITEKEIDLALRNIFRARVRLGMFDPAEKVPYTKISPDVIECKEHKALSLEVAQKSIVLLKNNGILPLKKGLKSIAIIGPTGPDAAVLMGNYNGNASELTTILEGITAAVAKQTRVLDFKGMTLTSLDTSNFETVRRYIAAEADVLVAVMGLSPELEGEEMPVDLDGFYKGDRTKLGLPGVQEGLLKACKDSGKPVVLVLTGGSPIAVNWAQENVDAILMAWYPGDRGGEAVADVLFGDVNPSGRLPLTFPKSEEQLPPFDDYSMVGRTYRYMTAEPLYTFGFGLSYTTFEYSKPVLSAEKIAVGDSLTFNATVKNTGKIEGEEVVQLYITDLEASTRRPLFSLKGIQRVSVASGESKEVSFTITPKMMELITAEGQPVIEPGSFRVFIGGASPSERSVSLGGAQPVQADFQVNEH